MCPLPLRERVARIVRCETGEGFSPRMQTPHPARTSHSRCEASASFEQNGGRRPPMATFSHKGRRKKRARRGRERLAPAFVAAHTSTLRERALLLSTPQVREREFTVVVARPGDVDGSACLTIFWHCGSPHLLFRRARASAPGNQPSTVLAEDDAFIGSGNADSQSNVRNSRASGRCRRSRSDSGCAAHRPASLRASASYQPLRAVWAFCAWALRGSREINRPPSALQRQRTSYKEFSK